MTDESPRCGRKQPAAAVFQAGSRFAVQTRSAPLTPLPHALNEGEGGEDPIFPKNWDRNLFIIANAVIIGQGVSAPEGFHFLPAAVKGKSAELPGVLSKASVSCFFRESFAAYS